MVPTDYRLEHVSARLIERLEGARRSFAGDPQRASSEFGRISEEHVEAAIGEFREVAMADNPEVHAAFLRREVLGTFLPRYERLAVDMTERETGGFGLGPLSEPVGRAALVAVAVLLLFFLLRFMYLPYIWPLVLLDLSLPFWPDILSVIHRNRYRRELETMLRDLQRIQEQSGAYLRPDQLKIEDPVSSDDEPPRNPTRETT